MKTDPQKAEVIEGRPPVAIKASVRQLSQRSNWLNWPLLTVDWAIVITAVACHWFWHGVLAYVLSIVVIGSRMRALANLLHEAAHYKLFSHRRMNNLAGQVLCGWPIFVGYKKYVADHRLHHQNLWRNERDPDLGLYVLTRTEGPSDNRMSFVWFFMKNFLLVLIPIIPLWRLWHDRIRDPHRSGAAVLVAVAVLALLRTVSADASATVVYYWIIPWMTTFQCINYWAEIGEHGGLRSFGPQWGSRNWQGNTASRWLIGPHSDDLYHLLHHWFPSVPHYRLRLLDSICHENWPEYSAEARCSGFLLGGRTGVSVLRDIWSGGATPPRIRPARHHELRRTHEVRER